MNVRELNDCPAAKLALRGLLYKSYALYRGVDMQPTKPEAVAPQDIKLAELSATLDIDRHVKLVMGMLQQYEVSRSRSNAPNASCQP